MPRQERLDALGTLHHLLIRTNGQSLSYRMRKLLTGYVVNFNRRHKRYGHLFQHRYKSIICEDDPYLLELTRYIHLNPLRAGLVKGVGELNRYRWTGYSAIMGRVEMTWQDVETALAYFGEQEGGSSTSTEDILSTGSKEAMVLWSRSSELPGGDDFRR